MVIGRGGATDDTALALAMALPRRLRLEGLLSGAVLQTEVGGVTVDVHVPQVSAGLALDASLPDAFKDLPQVDSASRMWGTPVRMHSDPWNVESFDVQVLGITVSTTGTEGAAAWTGQELQLWFEQVADWVEVLTGQVNDPQARRAQQPVWGEGVVRWQRDGDGWQAEAPRLMIDCSVPSADPLWGQPASADELDTAFDRVASRGRPMTRDLLLRDARVHLLAGDVRRSALDAGLAAELMLAQACGAAIDRGAQWPTERPPFEKATLGPLVRHAPALGVPVPVSLTKEEVGTRNDAAHGREVATQDVSRLLDAIFDLRNTLVPDWRLEVDGFGNH